MLRRFAASFAVATTIVLMALTAACDADPAETTPAGDSDAKESSGSGIWVTGKGSIGLEPDLVLLTVGVETTAETVAQARAEAAVAMDAVVEAVKAHGLEDRDIQTQSFNIWPRYEYPEVIVGDDGSRRQVLAGYTVSNLARIKVRNVDGVGAIIDDAAEAGGDATRIHSIDFTIEDPKPFMERLREEAVADARAKAEHLASLVGVEVGDLVYIGEAGAAPPPGPVFAEAMMARADASTTSISGGELELNLSVQALYSIVQDESN